MGNFRCDRDDSDIKHIHFTSLEIHLFLVWNQNYWEKTPLKLLRLVELAYDHHALDFRHLVRYLDHVDLFVMYADTQRETEQNLQGIAQW